MIFAEVFHPMQAGGLSGEASSVPMTFDDKHVFVESNKSDHKELLCAPIRLQMHLNSQSSLIGIGPVKSCFLGGTCSQPGRLS